MRAARRQGWLGCLLVAGGVLAGCGRGNSGPAELFLDSMVSAITSSGTPDLWVSSVSAPASAVSSSGSFVTVTACNQGAGSAGSRVNVYLSADTSITAGDTLVGSGSTGTLHPQQCATLHLKMADPESLTRGLFYVGARVDPNDAVSEASETNNARAGTRMALGSGADLTVARVSGPESLLPSARFETAVTVCNTGTAAAAPGHVEVYLSEDATVTAADFRVGSGATQVLSEGQCSTVRVDSVASVPEGSWHVGAWVNRAQAVAELTDSNNLRVGHTAAVGRGPDFTVMAVSGPASLVGGGMEPAGFQATVCNTGTQAGSTEVEVFLSEDAALTAQDARVGSAAVEALEPGQCTPVRVSGPVAVSSGRWFVAARVDGAARVTELRENNNTRFGNRPSVGSGPDLVVSEVRGPLSVSAEEQVSAAATVCNQGTARSAGAEVAFYLSLDTTVTTADVVLGTAPVAGLEVGECTPVKVAGAVKVEAGSWYVGASVDSGYAVAELSESNNARTGERLGVGAGAELMIASISAPERVRSEEPFTSQVTVCNQGTRPMSAGTRVNVSLSLDAGISAADRQLGVVAVPALGAGQCEVASVAVSAEVPEGSWYVGALVDRDGGEPELIEDNNVRVGGGLVVGNVKDSALTVREAQVGRQQG
ncbi:MAG TPA: CARDB domain-containing protein [Myxococcaceae bacterium]|nr:CARDB domain-containing protein [Myxococcaceae bacterium]